MIFPPRRKTQPRSLQCKTNIKNIKRKSYLWCSLTLQNIICRSPQASQTKNWKLISAAKEKIRRSNEHQYFDFFLISLALKEYTSTLRIIATQGASDLITTTLSSRPYCTCTRHCTCSRCSSRCSCTRHWTWSSFSCRGTNVGPADYSRQSPRC